jgi:nicotinic acid mononucleotide adenylyltransferase
MEFYFIMGSDLVNGLEKWDNGKELRDEVKFIIFQRKGHEIDLNDPTLKEKSLPKNFEEISND